MAASQPFKTAGLMKELMAKYYDQGNLARKRGVPVVWVTAVSPVELVYAAGLYPYYPENFGALAAARKVADKLSTVAEARGFFSDLCGYARCGLGDAYADEHPVGKIVRPDLLFCCNTQCGSLQKWFETASRLYRAPCLFGQKGDNRLQGDFVFTAEIAAYLGDRVEDEAIEHAGH